MSLATASILAELFLVAVLVALVTMRARRRRSAPSLIKPVPGAPAAARVSSPIPPITPGVDARDLLLPVFPDTCADWAQHPDDVEHVDLDAEAPVISWAMELPFEESQRDVLAPLQPRAHELSGTIARPVHQRA